MKLENHYITLYSHLGPTDVNVFISEIAELLSCSERHAKSLIKQMQDQQWITWHASSGRGNVSKLCFHISPQRLMQQQVQRWFENGDLKRAITWIEQQTELDQSFLSWINEYPQWIQNNGMDILRYPGYGHIHTLIPSEITSKSEAHIVEHVFNRLLQYNSEKDEFVQELAHYWEYDEEGLIWRFYLRKGIVFHDGSPLTSEVIKENIEFWDKRNCSWKLNMVEDIDHIDVSSPTVITFHLNKPNRLFPHVFTDVKSMIIPVHLYKNNPDLFVLNPVGSGPFRIKEHIRNYLVLESFSNYFGYQPLLDRIELYNIANQIGAETKPIDYRFLYEKSVVHTHKKNLPPYGMYIVSNHQKAGIHRQPGFLKMLAIVIKWLNPTHNNQNKDESQTTNDLIKAKNWFEEQGLTGQTISLIATNNEDHDKLNLLLQQLTHLFLELGITLHTDVFQRNQLPSSEQLYKAELILTSLSHGEDKFDSFMNALSLNTNVIYNSLPLEAKGFIRSLAQEIQQCRDLRTAYNHLTQIKTFLLDHNYILFLCEYNEHVKLEFDDSIQGVELNRYHRLQYQKLWLKNEREK
ncbi:SgrR family transcriptional regulator [Alkalihalobacillus sp. MEB130]|uniref:ABC transporter substrate-binding protein n=1 Tax=Alkalihalobacillus sp. MEB130 TaxID=2976704 RepID=UPI0028DDB9A3|nr:ABC transporter substrate-binding protein [Alkalihalobacillus sp. MEB130]MDT8861138.1 SgrR family transcriptional regulator [Alkalihalobacillus sp. MEB130]